MTLRTRFLLVTTAFVLLITIGAGLITALTIRRDDRRDTEERLGATAQLVTRLSVAYVDQETGQRGYLIAANPTFLEPYARGRSDAQRLIARLRRLAGRDFARRLSSVTGAATTWDRDAEGTIAAREAVRVIDPSTIAIGKTRFDALRVRIVHLQTDVDRAVRFDALCERGAPAGARVPGRRQRGTAPTHWSDHGTLPQLVVDRTRDPRTG